MSSQTRLPAPSRSVIDQLIADPSQIAKVPPESLPDVLAQVALRVAELKNLEGTLLLLLLSPRFAGSKNDGGGNLLSAPQVAKLFDVPESWVREQARLGTIPSIRLGHYMRFKAEEIERFVAERSRHAA